jgi:hypothetical protein
MLIMKLKELIEVLSNYDEELEVVFYGLEYFALEEKELESIQEADGRLEITIEL